MGFALTLNSTCAAFPNSTDIYSIPFTVPFYFTTRRSLIGGIPDNILALAAPVVAYWSMCLFFHFLDISGWTWLDQYRIHESDEVRSRNRATLSQVISNVMLQHIMQSAVAYYFSSDLPTISLSQCMMEMEAIKRTLARFAAWTVGHDAGAKLVELRVGGADISYWLYWWCIPTAQLFVAAFVFDTWEYFLHRWLHSNKFLYKHIHSVHHRLYVPYAFGTQYNNLFEGLVFETLGAKVAEGVARLSARQAALFFTLTTMKGVDGHCGYRFPFDPFQLFSGNNAEYHDIHHQNIGIKFNFSQPWFVHWDVIMGTRMMKEEFEERRRKFKAA